MVPELIRGALGALDEHGARDGERGDRARRLALYSARERGGAVEVCARRRGSRKVRASSASALTSEMADERRTSAIGSASAAVFFGAVFFCWPVACCALT